MSGAHTEGRKHHSCWCTSGLFVLFLFCLKEQKEKWSSPLKRHLSKATTPRTCSTQVSLYLCFALWASVADLGRVVAVCQGGLSQGVLCLVSRPKLPKPLLCAGFSGHAGKPSCSHSLSTTQSCFRVQWLRPASHMPSPMRECCPQHKTPSLCHCLGSGACLQLIPRARLLFLVIAGSTGGVGMAG